MPSKRCKACGESKPCTEFYRNSTISDGYDGTCKECKKEYQREWRATNRVRHQDYSRKYHHEHREERLEYYSRWVAENAERKALGTKRWREQHPSRMLAMRKIQNARRRALLIGASGDYTPREWMALVSWYGNRCLRCGATGPETKITPDHVVPLALGGSNSIDNLQPLCWSCNAAKGARVADYRPNAHEDKASTAYPTSSAAGHLG